MNQLSEHPQISMRSNFLSVDGHTLRADVLKDSRSEKITISPEQLESIVLTARRPLLEGIEKFYHATKLSNPGSTVVRPSVWTAQLGNTRQTDGQDSQVFTAAGYANGGINKSPDEIKEPFRNYWDALMFDGFLPEVRRSSGKTDGGSWLLLRKPTLSEVALHWFDFQETNEARLLREQLVQSLKEGLRTIGNLALTEYRVLGEEIVDTASNGEQTRRSKMQIGLILAMGAIKQTLGDIDGYHQEIDDAFEYADNSPAVGADGIRAIENSTYELAA